MHSESAEFEEICAYSANHSLKSAIKAQFAFATCSAFCAFCESKRSASMPSPTAKTLPFSTSNQAPIGLS
jgi:hypothetical protein